MTKVAYFRSMRPCPECGRGLVTDGSGQFLCRGCGYRDKQDVSMLIKKGLRYPVPRIRNMTFGKGTQVEGTM